MDAWNKYEFAKSISKRCGLFTFTSEYWEDTLIRYKYTEVWYCVAIFLYHLLVIASRLEVARQDKLVGIADAHVNIIEQIVGGRPNNSLGEDLSFMRVCRPPFPGQPPRLPPLLGLSPLACHFVLPSASFAHIWIHPFIICPDFCNSSWRTTLEM